jgi:hypothetical protein
MTSPSDRQTAMREYCCEPEVNDMVLSNPGACRDVMRKAVMTGAPDRRHGIRRIVGADFPHSGERFRSPSAPLRE